MNCSRPDWKPIMALAPVAGFELVGEELDAAGRQPGGLDPVERAMGSPPSWMWPRMASRASNRSPPSFSNSDVRKPVV